MYLPDANDTIIALSTPPFPGGIAVIRISGKDSKKLFEKIFRPFKKNLTIENMRDRVLTRGEVIANNPTSNTIISDTQIIDEVLGVVFRQPNSYTGEDMAEIHCHGNPYIAKKIIECAISFSNKNNFGVVRLAERGEFTYRAFLNGKIDLIQAEAVLSVIEARSEKSLFKGLSHLKGRLSKKISLWNEDLKNIMALVEFLIDMPEDSDPDENSYSQEIIKRITILKKSIDDILHISYAAHLFEVEIPVIIIGKPNAGKSSLFNALSREELAIVTPIAGTTRDIISEKLHWDGLTWKVSDTAGISSLVTSDIIEEIGRQKTLKITRDTQYAIILLVLDGSKPIDADDKIIVQHLNKQIQEKRVIALINKSDLPPAFSLEDARSILGLNKISFVKISAARNDGIDELKSTLSQHIISFSSDNISSVENDEVVVGNIRQKQILEKLSLLLSETLKDFPSGMEIVSHHLKFAAQTLGELTGEGITSEEILGEIFSKFCVGK